MKIIEIEEHVWERKCAEDVVKILAEVNEKAAKGEIVGLALAYVTPDGNIGTRASRSTNVFTLMGGVQMLAQRLIEGVKRI